MPAVDLKTILHDTESRNSLIRYRNMEHWCLDNVCQNSWRLDWAGTINVYGVDLPRRIIFDRLEDFGQFYRHFDL